MGCRTQAADPPSRPRTGADRHVLHVPDFQARRTGKGRECPGEGFWRFSDEPRSAEHPQEKTRRAGPDQVTVEPTFRMASGMSREARVRWTVACGSPRMPANSAESSTAYG